MLNHTLNVSKDACYQNPKVCFDLDLIAKNNDFLQTGSSQKRYEI